MLLYGSDILIVASVAILEIYRKELIKMDLTTLGRFLASDTQFQTGMPSTVNSDDFIKHVLKLWHQNSFYVRKDILSTAALRRSSMSDTFVAPYSSTDIKARTTPSLATTKFQEDRPRKLLDERTIFTRNDITPIRGGKRYTGKELVQELRTRAAAMSYYL
jgi:hypothetical protein